MRTRFVVVGVLVAVSVTASAAVALDDEAATRSAGVVTEAYRSSDWQLSGRSCPSGKSNGGIADTDGGTGEPSAEVALARLEERVVRQLPAGLVVARRQVKPGADRVESLLLADQGAIGGAMTERAPAGWQLTGWWFCSPRS